MRKILVVLAFRPHLWSTAVCQLLALAPSGWWRRRPFLPLPDADYLAFRMETMYGDGAASPAASDVVTYLEWCRNHREALR
ncbi:MAG TPA: hypothetical protein VM142_11880 [Acidimicrobiales bacterium]|nr:hypothetical protein [Acidimicrobiales bacterium]